MTVKDLITKLLDYPMDAELRVDMHPRYPISKIAEVGWDDDQKNVWITNYTSYD